MRKILLISAIIFIFSQNAVADHVGHEKLTLGFMPYLSSQLLLKKYQPLADYLSDALHKDVVITIAKDYDTHLKDTGEDRLDISFLGGSPYVLLTQKYGYKPLLAKYEFNNKPYFRSIFYTSNNSSLVSLDELKGKKVAFGSKRSTLSTQVPLYMLMEQGFTKEDVNISFVDNQENVVFGVLLGEFAAGAASEEIFKENMKKGLRALAYSPELSTHLFVASEKMPEELRVKIKNALLALKDKPGGKEILGSISSSLTGFVSVEDSDYNLLRTILAKVLPELD